MEKIDRSRFRPTKGIVMYKMVLEIQFREIEEFINEMSASVEIRRRELEEYVEREIKTAIDPNDEQKIIDFFMDDIIKYDQTYIELLMNSTFITSFSLFESAFKRICNYSKKEKGSQISLSGRVGVSQCYNYMKEVIEIDLDSINTLWERISTYNKVRNLIVHNSSNLVSDKNKIPEKHELYKFMTNNPFIHFKSHRRGSFYIKDHQFIIDFCENAKQYLSEVITKVIEETKTNDI